MFINSMAKKDRPRKGAVLRRSCAAPLGDEKIEPMNTDAKKKYFLAPPYADSTRKEESDGDYEVYDQTDEDSETSEDDLMFEEDASFSSSGSDQSSDDEENDTEEETLSGSEGYMDDNEELEDEVFYSDQDMANQGGAAPAVQSGLPARTDQGHLMVGTPPLRGNAAYNWPWLN